MNDKLNTEAVIVSLERKMADMHAARATVIRQLQGELDAAHQEIADLRLEIREWKRQSR